VYIPFLVNCSKDVITFVIGCECQAACIQCWRESYHRCVHTPLKIMNLPQKNEENEALRILRVISCCTKNDADTGFVLYM